MTSADRYRIRAAEFSAKAKSETAPELRMEYARMAASYLRLAALADRNTLTDSMQEPPPDHDPGAP